MFFDSCVWSCTLIFLHAIYVLFLPQHKQFFLLQLFKGTYTIQIMSTIYKITWSEFRTRAFHFTATRTWRYRWWWAIHPHQGDHKNSTPTVNSHSKSNQVFSKRDSILRSLIRILIIKWKYTLSTFKWSLFRFPPTIIAIVSIIIISLRLFLNEVLGLVSMN